MIQNNDREMDNKEEYKDDKCADCPYNDTDCPGGSWCSKED